MIFKWGMTGKGRKARCRKGSCEPAAHGLDGGTQGIEMLGHGLKRLQAHQAGKGQGQLGQYSPALDGHESSAQREQAIDGHGHVLVAGADHADVVAVMADRGGERAPAKAKALHEPAANIAVTAMALEHADLEQIVLRIGVPKAVAKGEIGL